MTNQNSLPHTVFQQVPLDFVASGSPPSPNETLKGPATHSPRVLTSHWQPSSNTPPSFWLHKQTSWLVVLLCLSCDVALIVLWWYSKTRKGLFDVNESLFVRLVWSSGPALLVTGLSVGLIAPLVFDVCKVAPYADLYKGGATAQTSLMVNYVTMGIFNRLKIAVKNDHWAVVAAVGAMGCATVLSTAASG
jgi:hypothetical protein